MSIELARQAAIAAMMREGETTWGMSAPDQEIKVGVDWGSEGERSRTVVALTEIGKTVGVQVSADEDIEDVVRRLYMRIMEEPRLTAVNYPMPAVELPEGCEWVALARDCPDGWDTCWGIHIVAENLVQLPPSRQPIIVSSAIDLDTVEQDVLEKAGFHIHQCEDML